MTKAIRTLLALAMLWSVAPVAAHSSSCPLARAKAAQAARAAQPAQARAGPIRIRLLDAPGEGSLFDLSRRLPGLNP